MNIDTDKAVEDLTWATLDGQIAEAATKDPAALRQYFRDLLVKSASHHELEDQMPESM
jgi:hypothetical protein